MDTVKNYLQNVENEMIDKVLEIVKQKSVKRDTNEQYPFGKDIHKALNYFESLTKEFDFPRTGRYEDYYAWVEMGDESLPLVGIVCHIDVVDYVAEDWQYNPLGELADGVLYGRGVSDNKGPIIQSLFAMKYLQEQNLPIRVRLIVGADEEKDFQCMKQYLANKEEMPEYGFIPDAKFPYILSEKGLLNITLNIDVDQFGLSFKEISGGTGTNITPNYAEVILEDQTKISATGVAAHVANDTQDPNAIVSLFEKMNTNVNTESFIGKFNAKIEHNYLKFLVDGQEIQIKPTFIEQNKDKIEMTFDTRIPVALSTAKAQALLLQHFSLSEEAVKRVNRADGYSYEANHPVIKLMDEVYGEAMDLLRPTARKAKPLNIPGTTYAKYFKNCITFGPGFPDEHSYGHREDERMAVQSFLDGTYIYIKLLKKMVEEDNKINFELQ